MSSVASRRSKAIELISAGKIHSQSDLVRELKKHGFVVTQATASRDLEEIGALRGRGNGGELTYALPHSADVALSHTLPLPSDLIISVEASANLAVVRTPPGGAQLLASALDRLGNSEIIGTIAGDDTVLVVSRKATGGAALAKELRAVARGSQSNGKKRVK